MQPCERVSTTQRYALMQDDFNVETKYGTVCGRAGDYLMEGATGALYILTAEDFKRCYRAA